MTTYYIIRIELKNLDSKNEKLEYRSLYNEINDVGFRDYYFDSHDEMLNLPNGMYAIMRFGFESREIFYKAEKAIETALKKYYPTHWTDKYTLMINGPGIILSSNLDPKPKQDKQEAH